MVPERVEFICSGNLCRSPFAEGVARALGVPATSVASSGIWAPEGACCPSEAVEAAAHFGVDLARHRARRTIAEELGRATQVAVMEVTHLRGLRKLLPGGGRPEVLLVGACVPGLGVEIPDPYGHPIARYLEV